MRRGALLALALSAFLGAKAFADIQAPEDIQIGDEFGSALDGLSALCDGCKSTSGPASVMVNIATPGSLNQTGTTVNLIRKAGKVDGITLLYLFKTRDDLMAAFETLKAQFKSSGFVQFTDDPMELPPAQHYHAGPIDERLQVITYDEKNLFLLNRQRMPPGRSTPPAKLF
ncbi:MAG TPA: hypothetical protein VKP60_23435 [Magnetospirillaceae bacterium]|nr:hypothetical protein [Magnetospirillaceae bacterium]